MKRILIYCLLGFLYLSLGCGEYEKLAIEKESRRLADSLFRAHKDSLGRVADSLCEERFSTYFKTAVDSVTDNQVEKIKKLIRK